MAGNDFIPLFTKYILTCLTYQHQTYAGRCSVSSIKQSLRLRDLRSLFAAGDGIRGYMFCYNISHIIRTPPHKSSRTRARVLYCRSRKLRKERAKTAEWDPRGRVATLRDTGEENRAKLGFGIRDPVSRTGQRWSGGVSERRSSPKY